MNVFLFQKGTLLCLSICAFHILMSSPSVSLLWSFLLVQSLGGAITEIKSKICATKISQQRKNTNQKCFTFFPKKILRSSPSNSFFQNVDDSLLVLQWYALKGSLLRTRQAPVILMSRFRLTIVTITININLCLTF